MENQTELLLSAAFELGVPIVLAIVAMLWRRSRTWVVVILGSVTPLLLFYAFTTAGYLLDQVGAQLAFPGMWRTSFFPFVACAAMGAVLSISRVPRTLSARYVLGLAPPAVLAVAWAIAARQ